MRCLINCPLPRSLVMHSVATGSAAEQAAFDERDGLLTAMSGKTLQSVSISGCAGATGDLWDALHAAARDALRQSHGFDADSGAGESQPMQESQVNMDVDSGGVVSPRASASTGPMVVGWSSTAAATVEHPLQHALTTLSAIRCTSMRSCRIGLARSADPSHEGALLLRLTASCGGRVRRQADQCTADVSHAGSGLQLQLQLRTTSICRKAHLGCF